jgi:hypothetical protein
MDRPPHYCAEDNEKDDRHHEENNDDSVIKDDKEDNEEDADDDDDATTCLSSAATNTSITYSIFEDTDEENHDTFFYDDNDDDDDDVDDAYYEDYDNGNHKEDNDDDKNKRTTCLTGESLGGVTTTSAMYIDDDEKDDYKYTLLQAEPDATSQSGVTKASTTTSCITPPSANTNPSAKAWKTIRSTDTPSKVTREMEAKLLKEIVFSDIHSMSSSVTMPAFSINEGIRSKTVDIHQALLDTYGYKRVYIHDDISTASSLTMTDASTKRDSPEEVVEQVLLDACGDKGVYTGDVLRRTRKPHGSGHMVYEDGRMYIGNWYVVSYSVFCGVSFLDTVLASFHTCFFRVVTTRLDFVYCGLLGWSVLFLVAHTHVWYSAVSKNGSLLY